MTESSIFYTADDIAAILTVSRPTAYRIIKRLNDELKDKGYIVVSGRVPKRYFNEKFYCWWKKKLRLIISKSAHPYENKGRRISLCQTVFLYIYGKSRIQSYNFTPSSFFQSIKRCKYPYVKYINWCK